MTNTVFFTGAGASHGSEFSLPVMKGFFEEEHLKNYPNLNNFIQKLYPKDPLEEVNMESFITHLEMSLEGFGASWGRLGGIVFDVRKEFTNYLVSRLSGPVEDKVCNKHLRLFRNMRCSERSGKTTQRRFCLSPNTLRTSLKKTLASRSN